MRLKTLALLAPAAALLAACSDSPVSTGAADADLYDLSKVTITGGDGTAPNIPAHARRAPSQPRAICYPDDGCYPTYKPEATFDYGSWYETWNDGTTKTVHIASWSDNYEHISNMSLTAHFRSVGAQGSQGCNATPQQFEQETVSGFGTPWGDHYSIWSERYASYPSSAAFVWQVDGDHTFTASLGYSVDGYYRVGTFYSAARVCH